MKSRMRRIGRQLTADKKKLSIILCLLAVGLLLWGRLLLKQVPKTATATPRDDAAASSDAGLGEVRLAKAEQRLEIDVATPAKLQRDLFAFDPSRYIRTSSPQLPDQSEKSVTRTADENAVVKKVREAAMRLDLQSVVQGDQPRAFINGRLVAPGEEIEGFKLLQVTDRMAVLELNGVVIRLGM